MAKRIPFGSNEIVVLEANETVANQCSGGDVAIKNDDRGAWVYFVSNDGEVDSWDDPFETVEEAIKAVQDNA